MGKAKKLKPSQMASKMCLEDDIQNTKFAKPKNRNKTRTRQDEDEQFVDSKITEKILKITREQQREMQPVLRAETSLKTNFTAPDSDSDSEDESVDVNECDNFFDNIQISQEDEEAINQFMSSDPKPRKTLADVIKEKLTEKKLEVETQFTDADSLMVQELDPRLVAVFEGCGEVLKRYRSGKLPKPFKAVHKFKDWEQILQITDPSSWSAAAMYQATRIFAANCDKSNAHKFYIWVLLPRIRDHLAEYKKLNFHLYQALVKALYKSTAFMTGIVLPLLESGDCTLREAIVIGSIIQKYSVPMGDSAVATLKIAEMDYTGANSIFLRIFLDKKYNLPQPTLNAVFQHFMKFLDDERDMPVLWQQSLLTFVQRYKAYLTKTQRNALYTLVNKQYHSSISPIIHRELQHAECRND